MYDPNASEPPARASRDELAERRFGLRTRQAVQVDFVFDAEAAAAEIAKAALGYARPPKSNLFGGLSRSAVVEAFFESRGACGTAEAGFGLWSHGLGRDAVLPTQRLDVARSLGESARILFADRHADGSV
jgi:hypothetical protein